MGASCTLGSKQPSILSSSDMKTNLRFGM